MEQLKRNGMEKMSKPFVPVKYLSRQEKDIMDIALAGIKSAGTLEEVKRMEHVLDILLEVAVDNYKQQNLSKKK